MAEPIFNPSILALLGVLSLIDGFAMLILYREMRNNPQVLMSKFKLNSGKTVRDFAILLIANVGLAISMAILALGVYTSKSLILVSYMGQGLFALLVVAVFTSWVRDYAIR